MKSLNGIQAVVTVFSEPTMSPPREIELKLEVPTRNLVA